MIVLKVRFMSPSIMVETGIKYRLGFLIPMRFTPYSLVTNGAEIITYSSWSILLSLIQE